MPKVGQRDKEEEGQVIENNWSHVHFFVEMSSKRLTYETSIDMPCDVSLFIGTLHMNLRPAAYPQIARDQKFE